ncbi:BURP domain-containing protein 3-like [Humulus lupulus]|uniref:BURP domain-containing protein 3-like n=1 Tax=Humulus lupulus TaxID=3486 RepID=UPI002B401B2A|nr:BURP domain-containing protein 3-like [Humulus lupulus]
MALHFPIEDHSRFLPKEVADSIPFSISQLPNLLQLFSITKGSSEAKYMEETIQDCGIKPIDGEIKRLNLLSTTHPTMATAVMQNYTVLEVPKEVLAPKMVVCHPVPYPYDVFFCHHFGTETKVFQATFGGKNGNNVEAVIICHMDISYWDPDHILFQLLRVKPGVSSPVCHFLPTNHLVWIPSPIIETE